MSPSPELPSAEEVREYSAFLDGWEQRGKPDHDPTRLPIIERKLLNLIAELEGENERLREAALRYLAAADERWVHETMHVNWTDWPLFARWQNARHHLDLALAPPTDTGAEGEGP